MNKGLLKKTLTESKETTAWFCGCKIMDYGNFVMDNSNNHSTWFDKRKMADIYMCTEFNKFKTVSYEEEK